MGIAAQGIEDRFHMPVAELRRRVAANPRADSEERLLIHWYDMLAQAQIVVEEAEDALVSALSSRAGVIDDPVMELAHRLNAAVGARDGRALVVTYLLDPDAPGKRTRGKAQDTAPAPRRPPALSTAAVPVPHRPTVPVRKGR